MIIFLCLITFEYCSGLKSTRNLHQLGRFNLQSIQRSHLVSNGARYTAMLHFNALIDDIYNTNQYRNRASNSNRNKDQEIVDGVTVAQNLRPLPVLLPILASIAVVSLPGLVLASDSVSQDSSSTLELIRVVKPILDTLTTVLSILFLCRVVISWYPKTNLKEFPYNIIAWPTEPLAEPVRALIPPAFGVDISPLVWIGLLSFVKEILTGQQGILTLIEKNSF